MQGECAADFSDLEGNLIELYNGKAQCPSPVEVKLAGRDLNAETYHLGKDEANTW